MQASDQMSFVRKGVPAVQIFTGAHGDYHRPGDTADKIDGPGLVKVATFVREGVIYLAERAEPLTNTIAPAGAAASPSRPSAAPTGQPATGRRVSFGTVPDFAFEGPGVRVGGLVDGSPAQKADIREGDVITALDGRRVANLQAFSSMLGSFTPGQTVQATVVRAGKALTVTVTLAER
jgi:S1-C subfamily serine protease